MRGRDSCIPFLLAELTAHFTSIAVYRGRELCVLGPGIILFQTWFFYAYFSRILGHIIIIFIPKNSVTFLLYYLCKIITHTKDLISIYEFFLWLRAQWQTSIADKQLLYKKGFWAVTGQYGLECQSVRTQCLSLSLSLFLPFMVFSFSVWLFTIAMSYSIIRYKIIEKELFVHLPINSFILPQMRHILIADVMICHVRWLTSSPRPYRPLTLGIYWIFQCLVFSLEFMYFNWKPDEIIHICYRTKYYD